MMDISIAQAEENKRTCQSFWNIYRDVADSMYETTRKTV